jgi:hypothetical protein
MTDDPGKLAEQGDIQAMLWCSRNLREPEDRSRWWFRAIEAAHAGSADFDYFARAYGKWERWLEEEVDPYQGEKALAPLRDHVRTWLLKRCGLSFAQIKSSLAPDQWEDRDYGALPKKSLKRRHFDHKGLLLLAALADCELQCLDVLQLLILIRDGGFDSEVFPRDERTWQKLGELLVERWQDA